MVLESKGGTSTLGSREIKNLKDVELAGKRAQQGSKEYLLDIVEGLKKKHQGNDELLKLFKEIEKNIYGEKLFYVKYQQAFDTITGDLATPILQCLNLNKNIRHDSTTHDR